MLEKAAQHRGVSMNAEIVRRLEGSFEPRDDFDSTNAGLEILKAMSKLTSLNTSAPQALEVQGHLVRVLEELFPLPPGKKYDVRFEGDRIVSDLIVDEDR